MSLYQYGFTRQASRKSGDAAVSDSESIMDSQPRGIEIRYLPENEQTQLGADEYDQVVVAVKDLWPILYQKHPSNVNVGHTIITAQKSEQRLENTQLNTAIQSHSSFSSRLS